MYNNLDLSSESKQTNWINDKLSACVQYYDTTNDSELKKNEFKYE